MASPDYSVKRFNDHSWSRCFKRTIAAQIHFVAFLISLYGLRAFWLEPQLSHNVLVACSIFVLTGSLTMLVSTIYHFISDGFIIGDKLMRVLENLDHFCIYIFIAGTYTPFLIGVIKPPWQLVLLVAIWVIAILGILYTLFKPILPVWAQSRLVSTAVFLAMGWVVIVRIGEVWANLNGLNFIYLFGGGLAYSIGAIVYVLKRPNPWPAVFGFHEIWHIAVALGFAIHYAMIYNLFIV